MGYIMKFYVDADETLINWAMWLEVNKEFVKVLQEGLSSYNFKLVIWSMFGKKWAEKYSKQLFPDLDITYGTKKELYQKVPYGSFAIDNRKEQDKEYLLRFKKVFTSEEFLNIYQHLLCVCNCGCSM